MRQFALALLLMSPVFTAAGENPAPVHKGVATCASSLCHGSARPKPQSPLLRNEYLTWQRHDEHAGAWQTLKNERSKRIARRLDIGPAHEADICLDCHTDNVPEERRGEQFQISDGVGCETCHGGAQHWLQSHTGEEVSHAENVDNGLVPLERAEVRARVCQDCHVGGKDQFAGHDILGAGHPRLQFELMSYSMLQPAHYQADADYYERKPQADRPARIWARGQIAAARRMLEGLRGERFMDSAMWPELAFFDCHACHASMSVDRPAERYTSPELPPGSPRLNDSALMMVHILNQVLPGGDPERWLGALRDLHGASRTNPEAVARHAKKLQDQLDPVAQRLRETELTGARQRRLLEAMAAAGAQGRFGGYLTAEQAAMAAQVLLKHGDTGFDRDPDPLLDPVFEALANPDRMERGGFRRAMEQLRGSLR